MAQQEELVQDTENAKDSNKAYGKSQFTEAEMGLDLAAWVHGRSLLERRCVLLICHFAAPAKILSSVL